VPPQKRWWLVGRYLDIATSATQAQRYEATGDEGSGGFAVSKGENAGARSNPDDDGAVFFAADQRQRNRRLLEDRGEPGEISESSERRSGGMSPRCLHGTTVTACALCSGYARWLIAGGDARISDARRDPEAARRAFWREAGDGSPICLDNVTGGYPTGGIPHRGGIVPYGPPAPARIF
jgi:hypothetical protein